MKETYLPFKRFKYKKQIRERKKERKKESLLNV